MNPQYTIEPKKIDGDLVVNATGPEDTQFYGVYLKGVRERWTVGGLSEESPHLSTHLRDFGSQESAQKFVEQLQANQDKLDAIGNHEPVEVAGVRYQPSSLEGVSRYVAEGGRSVQDDRKGSPMPVVETWELQCYLATGEMTPSIAANALYRPADQKAFDRQNLAVFAHNTAQDPDFSGYHAVAKEYRDAEGIKGDLEMRPGFTLADMPGIVQSFVKEHGNDILNNPKNNLLATGNTENEKSELDKLRDLYSQVAETCSQFANEMFASAQSEGNTKFRAWADNNSANQFAAAARHLSAFAKSEDAPKNAFENACDKLSMAVHGGRPSELASEELSTKLLQGLQEISQKIGVKENSHADNIMNSIRRSVESGLDQKKGQSNIHDLMQP